jgi:hypothetical protein
MEVHVDERRPRQCDIVHACRIGFDELRHELIRECDNVVLRQRRPHLVEHLMPHDNGFARVVVAGSDRLRAVSDEERAQDATLVSRSSTHGSSRDSTMHFHNRRFVSAHLV